MKWFLIGGLVTVLGLAGALAVTASIHEDPAPHCGNGALTASSQLVDGYDAEQIDNAVDIINVGVSMGASFRDQVIAVMTAMGESSLRNIAYGDWETSRVTNPDGTPTSSLGLFQQQRWWGTAEQRMDPVQSSRLFYERLLALADRGSMSPTLVAHSIQRNADPFHYEKYWNPASFLAAALTGSAGEMAMGSASPWTVPVAGTWVATDRFGPRAIGFHSGMDMAVPLGTEVLAATGGTVTIIADQGPSGLGKYITINVGDGMTMTYGHLSSFQVVTGQAVSTGHVIAASGSSGYSTGPHLHFEIRVNGTPVDPEPLLLAHQVMLDGSAGIASPESTSGACSLP